LKIPETLRSASSKYQGSYFADLSLNQWMALTPRELLQDHLKLDQKVISALRKEKHPIVTA
jgi:oxalate decarboxylase